MYINRLMGRSEKIFTCTSLYYENKLVNDPVKIADIFNEHFSTVAERLHNDLPSSSVEPTSYLNLLCPPNSFFLSPTDPFEVKKITKTITHQE